MQYAETSRDWKAKLHLMTCKYSSVVCSNEIIWGAIKQIIKRTGNIQTVSICAVKVVFLEVI